MLHRFGRYSLLLILLATNFSASFAEDAYTIIDEYFSRLKSRDTIFQSGNYKPESVDIDRKGEKITIVVSKNVAATPIRPLTISSIKDSLHALLPDSLKNFVISLQTQGKDLDYLIPNYFNASKNFDKARTMAEYKGAPIVNNTDKPIKITKGLQNRNIALWSSHGRYYEPQKHAWIWQRPRLFGIVEDTYTASIVLPYLLPMLENAGASVFLPRERDCQTFETIVDNDKPGSGFKMTNQPKSSWVRLKGGFKPIGDTIFNNDNPFKMGTYLSIKGRKNGQARASWTPSIPQDGDYAVYISYATVQGSTDDARYIVKHSGGSTAFTVNQNMGGGTWIYLGTFNFKKGKNPLTGSVSVTNQCRGILTADAVRFGGGKGCIARPDKPIASATDSATAHYTTSNMPKYLEGARYWLQWAGYDKEVYSPNHGANEYKDDFMSRALWVNALMGGSMRLPGEKGKNVPLDLALAIHSDAGTKVHDFVGSMAIFMTSDYADYKSGTARVASRDLADLILDQTVRDIRQTFGVGWIQRRLTDDTYYEARVPEVPTMLFEFLSHQNYSDMKLALDPNFKFTVARSIYKAILKYVAAEYSKPFTIQPLPVKNFNIEFYNKSQKSVYLEWTAQQDSLEPLAQPTSYILYTSKNGSGFDNGQIVTTNRITLPIGQDTIYSFYVTAVNDGGESFPSETLSVGKSSKQKGTVLVVNGFDRVSGPISFENERYAGFINKLDPGIAYKKDICFTGEQYDFDRNSQYVDNEHPGHGASYSNYEDMVISGNTFNYPFVHGKSILANGYSFTSTSCQAFKQGNVNTKPYTFVDIIFGKQKEVSVGSTSRYTTFDPSLCEALMKHMSHNGNVFISGEFVTSDSYTKENCDTSTIAFIEDWLKCSWSSQYANTMGQTSISIAFDNPFSGLEQFSYHTEPNEKMYQINCPDILQPTHQAKAAFCFPNTNEAACTFYNGTNYKTIVSSIPFETIKRQSVRDQYMAKMLTFFSNGSDRSKAKAVRVKAPLHPKAYISKKTSYKKNSRNNL